MTSFKYSAGAAARTMPTYEDGTCNTLTADWHAPAIAMLVSNTSANGSNVNTEDLSYTLDRSNSQAICATQYGEELAGTFTARHSSPCPDRGQSVIAMASTHSHAECETGGFAPTLTAHNGVEAPLVMMQANAECEICPPRRLTPMECERLQGFPDGYTDLTGCDVKAVVERVSASLGYDDGQRAGFERKVAKWSMECPDGPRYKAIGNSFAVPVVRWIGERIRTVDENIRLRGEVMADDGDRRGADDA